MYYTKCLILFVATIFVSQIVATPHTRRGYPNRGSDHSIIISEEPFIHPPWWQGRSEEVGATEPNGSNEAYEINHGLSGGTSEEEDDIPRPPVSPRTPGYGRPSWWRPTGSSTTERRPPNNGNGERQWIAMCIKSCPVTAEFNPVCGTNNVTYGNPGRLECEQKCGVNVQQSRPTACSVPLPNPPEIYPNSEAVKTCIRNCAVTSEFNPVCGTNNVTYTNGGRLLCDQYCGIRVDFSKVGPCFTSGSNPPKNKEQRTCILSCPVTAEYNPICGSDNVTYANPGSLECAQNCGVVVSYFKQGSCGASVTEGTSENENTGGFSAICMRSCPVTSEYNPVCGSNGITYGNPGRLECAQNCGVAVKLVRNTSCGAPIITEENKINENDHGETTLPNSIINNNITTQRPYINHNGNGNSDKNDNNLNNNNFTNENSGQDSDKKESNDKNETEDSFRDKNNKNKGNDKDKGKDNNTINGNSQNTLDGVNKETTESKGHPNKGENKGNGYCKEVNRTPPSLQEVMACMQTCSLTSESNPVCGTDSITYMNPGRLLCAQFCGVDVTVKKFAPCDSTSITNVYCLHTCTNPPVTDKSEPVTSVMPSIQACMEACPASIEFKPVCGTNNISYRNLEKLQCARRCGVDVSLKRYAHCSAPEEKPVPKDNATLILECIDQCSIPLKYEPICGSNNVTYNNTGHLICARQCGLNIEVKQQHACSIEAVTPTPTPATNPTTESVIVTPGPNGVNFTIDPEILANIWGTTSSTTPNNEDEDFGLDQRVQDKKD